MKAEALLRREPRPDRDAIAHALAGNLCRCTGYAAIIEAIDLAAVTYTHSTLPTIQSA